MGLISISLRTDVKKKVRWMSWKNIIIIKQIFSFVKTLKFHLFLFERFIDLQSMPQKESKAEKWDFYFRSASQYDIKLSNCLSEG